MELNFDQPLLSIGIVIEACALGLTGILISLAFFVFNVRLRSNRVIKMSSPILNLFITSGGLLLSICCALFGLDYFLRDFTDAASAVCQTRAGLLACGSTLLFGPMFLKAWRVHRLFRNAGKRRVIIKDSRLLLMTSGLLLVDIILVVIWQTTDPLVFRPVLLYRQIVPQQAQNLSITKTQLTRVHACTSPSSPSWLAAFLLLKMAVLCYGLFLSWQTRAVALPSMNDSRCIVVSSMTTIVVTTVAVSVSHLLQQHPNAVYASVVMSVWMCTMVALCMAFVPKVALWWRNPEAKGLHVSLASTCSTAPVHPLEQLQDELLQAEAENEVLRKSLEEKEASVRKLQQHLISAHKRLSHLGLNLDFIQDSGLDADFSSSFSDPEDAAGHEADCDSPPPSSPTSCTLIRTDNSRRQYFQGGNPQREPSKGRKFASLEPAKGGLVSNQESSNWKQVSAVKQDSRSTGSASGRYSSLSSSSGRSAGSGPTVNAAVTSAEQAWGRRMTSPDGYQCRGVAIDMEKISQGISPAERYPHSQNARKDSSAFDGLFLMPSSRPMSVLSDNGKASSTHSSDRSHRKRRRRHRRRHSATSVTSFDKLSEIRSAIAQDLQHARSLSNILSNSVSKELDNVYRRHRRLQRRRSSSTKSREDLAGSIVGSYGLEDTTDTYSYVSSFLSVPSLHVTNEGYAGVSLGDVSVLDNDALYPDRRRKNSMTSRAGTDHVHKNTSKGKNHRLALDSQSTDMRLVGGSEVNQCLEQSPPPKLVGEQSYSRSVSPATTLPKENYDRHAVNAGRVQNSRLSSSSSSASHPGCVQDNRRSFSDLQNSSGRSQEVFSVQTARSPRFVQADYAQMRALYSMDTFI